MPATNRTVSLLPFKVPKDVSLQALREAFTPFSDLVFNQHWRPSPEAEFQPATLKAGWCTKFLHILATFTDHDIVVLESGNTQSRLAVGDVFQFFLSRSGTDEYLELHVTPNNQTQVLEWTTERFKAFLDGEISLDEILRTPDHPPLSDTWIEESEAQWTAYLRIPAELAMPDKSRFTPETILEGTFCRYDASPGAPMPVVSSTSAFPEKPHFHLNQHWHQLNLAR